MSALKKVFAALFAILLITAQAGAAEVIRDFKSEVQIEADSSLTVVESLLINVENIQIKRGIVRHFPIYYTDKEGREFSVGFDVESVTLDGREVPWQVEEEGQYANLRIGDRDSYVTPGLRRYVIKYKTTRQIGFFEEFDELYWNATGNYWSWPILKASCTVKLPAAHANVAFRSIEWYVGEYGQKGEQTSAKLIPPDTVAATRTLMPGEGLTVVYTFPKGLVTPPPPFFGNTKAQTAAAAAALAAVVGWLIFAMTALFKKPVMPPIIARFYPPKGASPAYVRYMLERQCAQTAFTANVMDMAVKGALRIISKEKTGFFGRKHANFSLEKQNAEAELTQDERSMFEAIFEGNAKTVKVEQINAEAFDDARCGMVGTIEMLCSSFFKQKTGIAVTGALITAAGIAAMLPFIGEALETPFACAIGCALIIFMGITRGGAGSPTRGAAIKRSIANALFSLPVIVIASALAEGLAAGGLPTLLFTAAATVIAATVPFLSYMTKEGAEIYAEAAGLKLYISVAEKDRLTMLNPPDETPELFERLLPYAVATGEVKAWSARFEDVLKAADYKPQWYVGATPFLFMNSGAFGQFARDLDSSFVSGMNKPDTSPTFSSGSGGGGFSGGGGGGGGGSGW